MAHMLPGERVLLVGSTEATICTCAAPSVARTFKTGLQGVPRCIAVLDDAGEKFAVADSEGTAQTELALSLMRPLELRW